MTLRLRTLLTVGLTLAALVLAFETAGSAVLRQSIARAEAREMSQVVQGVSNIISLTVEQFDTRFTDWSDWDDTYAFVKDRNAQYVRSNLVDKSLSNLHVGLVVFADPSGRIVWGTGFDQKAGRRTPVPPFIRERLLSRDPRFHPEPGTSTRGIIDLPEGPMIVSIRPILTSESQGPCRGVQVMGRPLSASEVEKLAQASRVSLVVARPGDPSAPADLQGALPHLSADGAVWTQPIGPSSIAGYRLVRDLNGHPVLLVRVTAPRAIYAQGRASARQLLASVVLIGLVFGAITLLFLERSVLSRLSRFSGEVRQIAEHQDLHSRTSATGTDELAQLGQTVNGMLASLEEFERERQASNARLRETTAAAEAASRAKSGFLANMSHELRTPMNAIIGFSELLEDERFGPLAEKQRKYVRNILGSGRHLLQLINDILDLSKVEAGRMDLAYQTVPLAEAVGDVVGIVRSLAHKKEIGLSTEIDPAELLDADPAKFKQIVYNLLSNAVKFTPFGGSITVRVAAAPAELLRERGLNPAVRFLLLSVTDSGIGISPKNLERIFLEFEQVDSSYSRQQQGTGLGLALTRKLAELHGGRIWAESAGEGAGTTFHVCLPAGHAAPVPVEGAEPVDSDASEQADADAAPRPLVLVVEDERPSGELLQQFLEEAGYAVARAWDGEEAIRMARELQPFAITLDVLLPKRDGWEVLAELKSLPDTRAIPVVMVSITDDPGNSYALGAAEFLVKPVSAERLQAALQKAEAERGRPVTTVLVVDDEPSSIEILTTTLRASGYSVLSARDGNAGVELARSHRPDAIVLDLVMPGTSGFDVVEHLQGHPDCRDVPIVICTAKDLTPDERRRLNSKVGRIAAKGSRSSLIRELRAVAPARKETV